MAIKRGVLLAGAALAVAFSVVGQAAVAATVTYAGPLTLTLYSDASDTGSGISLSDPFATTSVGAVWETADYGGVNNTPLWPNGDTLFSAEFTGTIDASSAGTYDLGFAADDAGYVYINGVQVDYQPGPTSLPGLNYFPVTLDAGANSLEVTYINEEATQAAIELTGSGLAVPEAATWAMLLIGVGLVGTGLRIERRNNVTAPNAT